MQSFEQAKVRLGAVGRKLWNARKRRVWPKTQPDLEMSGISDTAWRARLEAPAVRDYPNAWRGTSSPLAALTAESSLAHELAVVVFLHDPAELSDYLEVISRIGDDHDLFVLGSPPVAAVLADRPRTVFLPLQERGQADADSVGLGLFYLANSGALDPYRQVLCLSDLAAAARLIPDAEAASAARAALSGPRTGLVAAPQAVSRLGSYDALREGVEFLARRIGIETVFAKASFVEAGAFWVRAFLLQVLAVADFAKVDLYPSYEWDLPKLTPTVMRLLGVLASEAGTEVLASTATGVVSGRDTAPRDSILSAQALALFEPAFTRVPLDDRFWGRGYRPLPSCFSDLGSERPGTLEPSSGQDSLPGALQEASAWARYSGLTGFLVRSYWFAGQSVLGDTLDALLASPEIGIRFALLWENSDWTTPFVGGVEQVPAAADFDAFPASEYIESVLPALADPRYVRLDGRLLLVVSDPEQIPDFAQVTRHWQARVEEEGLGRLLVLGVAQLGVRGFKDAKGVGGYALIPPKGVPWASAPLPPSVSTKRFFGRFLSYASLAKASLTAYRALEGRKVTPGGIRAVVVPGVMTAFDSWPSKNASAEVFRGANPLAFRAWIQQSVEALKRTEMKDRAIFVRAWNDWASGSVMEPTKRWGNAYLQASRDLLGPSKGANHK